MENKPCTTKSSPADLYKPSAFPQSSAGGISTFYPFPLPVLGEGTVLMGTSVISVHPPHSLGIPFISRLTFFLFLFDLPVPAGPVDLKPKFLMHGPLFKWSSAFPVRFAAPLLPRRLCEPVRLGLIRQLELPHRPASEDICPVAVFPGCCLLKTALVLCLHRLLRAPFLSFVSIIRPFHSRLLQARQCVLGPCGRRSGVATHPVNPGLTVLLAPLYTFSRIFS